MKETIRNLDQVLTCRRLLVCIRDVNTRVNTLRDVTGTSWCSFVCPVWAWRSHRSHHCHQSVQSSSSCTDSDIQISLWFIVRLVTSDRICPGFNTLRLNVSGWDCTRSSECCIVGFTSQPSHLVDDWWNVFKTLKHVQLPTMKHCDLGDWESSTLHEGI